MLWQLFVVCVLMLMMCDDVTGHVTPKGKDIEEVFTRKKRKIYCKVNGRCTFWPGIPFCSCTDPNQWLQTPCQCCEDGWCKTCDHRNCEIDPYYPTWHPWPWETTTQKHTRTRK